MSSSIWSILANVLIIFAAGIFLRALFVFYRMTREKRSAGLAEEPHDAESILRMIRAGRRIQAMKAIRGRSGISLTEALDVVKAAERGDTSLLERYLFPQ
jgi:ribosomal protein L7/L12